jgi:predicted RNA-binding protein with PIN domain
VAARPTTPLFFFGVRFLVVRFSGRKPKTEPPKTGFMPFIIDGYNLLHAMGILGGPVGPNQLAKARAALVGLASSVHDTDPATIVFDAVGAPPGVTAEEVHGLVRVEFATGEEADDRIEWLIAHDAAPKRLVIVSDDHRLQVAGRRRGCQAWKCDEYLDWAKKVRRAARAKPTVEKPAGMGPLETERWLAAFGELDRDPAWDELFGPFDEQE